MIRVRHFAHLAPPGPSPLTRGEGGLHLLAKYAVYAHCRDWLAGEARPPTISAVCVHGHAHQRSLPPGVAGVELECRLPAGIVADVALTDAHSAPLLSIEIRKANPVSATKREQIGSLAWVELAASDAVQRPGEWRDLVPFECAPSQADDRRGIGIDGLSDHGAPPARDAKSTRAAAVRSSNATPVHVHLTPELADRVLNEVAGALPADTARGTERFAVLPMLNCECHRPWDDERALLDDRLRRAGWQLRQGDRRDAEWTRDGLSLYVQLERDGSVVRIVPSTPLPPSAATATQALLFAQARVPASQTSRSEPPAFTTRYCVFLGHADRVTPLLREGIVQPPILFTKLPRSRTTNGAE